MNIFVVIIVKPMTEGEQREVLCARYKKEDAESEGKAYVKGFSKIDGVTYEVEEIELK